MKAMGHASDDEYPFAECFAASASGFGSALGHVPLDSAADPFAELSDPRGPLAPSDVLHGALGHQPGRVVTDPLEEHSDEDMDVAGDPAQVLGSPSPASTIPASPIPGSSSPGSTIPGSPIPVSSSRGSTIPGSPSLMPRATETEVSQNLAPSSPASTLVDDTLVEMAASVDVAFVDDALVDDTLLNIWQSIPLPSDFSPTPTGASSDASIEEETPLHEIASRERRVVEACMTHRLSLQLSLLQDCRCEGFIARPHPNPNVTH